MKLLDIYEGYDPLFLMAHVQWGLFQQTWRGSVARGWYQPKNGRIAGGKILRFLDRQALAFRRGQRPSDPSNSSGNYAISIGPF
ncbi:hypothetical protein LCGC14_1678370 [marine sediment metagenome]|uniref:Uncharacterized protein n=1 Tax=marine sediment metagenome TaxID=412755 RepID=A0A0F9KPB7_9ZZZZ